ERAGGGAGKQRDRKLLFERADLPRHRRLRQSELLAGMGEAAGLGGGVENFQFVPIHFIGRRTTDDGRRKNRNRAFLSSVLCHPSSVLRYSAAARCSARAARKRSASSAAMQPKPAAVTAWR